MTQLDNSFKKLSPWRYSATYYWNANNKGYLIRCHGAVIRAELIKDSDDDCWYVSLPDELRLRKEDAEVPLRLMFEVDLWLFENGYEVEDLFVFPEAVG